MWSLILVNCIMPASKNPTRVKPQVYSNKRNSDGHNKQHKLNFYSCVNCLVWYDNHDADGND